MTLVSVLMKEWESLYCDFNRWEKPTHIHYTCQASKTRINNEKRWVSTQGNIISASYKPQIFYISAFIQTKVLLLEIVDTWKWQDVSNYDLYTRQRNFHCIEGFVLFFHSDEYLQNL